MDLAEFISHHYYKDDTSQGIEKVRGLLSYPGVYSEGIPDNGIVLVYITVSEDGLRLLRGLQTPDDFKNNFTERVLKYPGNHIYVFRMVTDGTHTLKELRQLRARIMQKHKAQSFSWHDNNRILLHTHEA